MLLLFLLFIAYFSPAQPFQCNGDLFLTLTNNGPSVFYRVKIDPASNQVLFIPLPAQNAGLVINAIGYRTTDNYIYGIQAGSSNLCRVDATGTATVVATLNGLNPSIGYYAGDVSQDGLFLYLIGTGGSSYLSRELVRVNLEDYTTELYTIPNAEEIGIICSDFSFDLTDGSLYAFDDKENRLLKFDPTLGMIDETLYPESDIADAIGATFIDAFGNLYGYGRRKNTSVPDTFFKIDKSTGVLTTVATGPEAIGKDGCACPYTVKLQKLVYPEVAIPCDEVTYVFNIVNASSTSYSGQDFLDVLPEALTITEIQSIPFEGTIVSGIGSNVLSIENINIPIGLDSIVIKAEVAQDALGTFKNQAVIKNLPVELGTITYSDDPNTLVIDDSTVLDVIPLNVNIEGDDFTICSGETLELIANSVSNANYQWSNGSTSASTFVNAEGWYWVEASSECETAIDSIYVYDESLNIELGPDIGIELGDSVLLEPYFTGNPEFQWTDSSGDFLDCSDCLSVFVGPYFDATYYLNVENDFGCTESDSINIHLLKDRKIYIPNTFSPNADGVNDRFYVLGKGYGLIRVI